MRAWTLGVATVRWGGLALAFGVAASHPTTSAHASATPRGAITLAPLATVTPQAEGQHGDGKKGGGNGFKESVVYVDGQAKGVLRFSELPSSMKPIAIPQIDELDVPRYYKLADYLEGLGIDLGKIRELQIYGSHDRIAIITGDEIRTLRDGLVFDFTQQTAGKARARWAQLHTLPHRPMVDVIMTVSIYVDKAAPTLAHGDMWLDGKVVDDPVPYVGDGVPKGTRVYADGKLDGWVRRKTLPSKLLAPNSEQVARQVLHGRVPRVRGRRHAQREGDRLLRRGHVSRSGRREDLEQDARGTTSSSCPRAATGRSRSSSPATRARGSLPSRFMRAAPPRHASPILRPWSSKVDRTIPRTAAAAAGMATEMAGTTV
jgi:hypothetical protein